MIQRHGAIAQFVIIAQLWQGRRIAIGVLVGQPSIPCHTSWCARVALTVQQCTTVSDVHACTMTQLSKVCVQCCMHNPVHRVHQHLSTRTPSTECSQSRHGSSHCSIDRLANVSCTQIQSTCSPHPCLRTCGCPHYVHDIHIVYMSRMV